MPAHLEVTGGIIRFSGRSDWTYGEPYDFAFYVHPVDSETVILKAFAGKIDWRVFHELKDILRGQGWKTVKWERHHGGKVSVVSLALVSEADGKSEMVLSTRD